MSQLRTTPARRRGAALFVGLVVITSLGMMALIALQTSLGSTRALRLGIDTKRAMYIAEAGLSEAFVAVSVGRTGEIGSSARPAAFGDGLFWVTGEPQSSGDIVLTSVGLCGTARVELEYVVQRPYLDKVKRGLVSAADLVLPPGVLVDGYDSYVGPYELQLENWKGVRVGRTPGRIESAGQVRVVGHPTSPTVISADVHHGLDALVSLTGAVSHRGDEEPIEEIFDLPPVRIPSVPSTGSRTISTPIALPRGDSGFETLTVVAGGELIVVGPALLVLDELLVESGGRIIFDVSEGPIDVIAKERIELRDGSIVETPDARPSSLTIQVAGGASKDVEPRLKLQSHGSIHGFVYVPRSTALVGPELELFGGLTAASVALAGGARVHVDEDLVVGVFDCERPLNRRGWRVLEVAEIPRVGAFQDPFHFLGVDPDTVLPAHKLHALTNVHLHIEYVDLGGVKRKATVFESDFDWTTVKAVTSLKRHQKKR